MPQYDSAHLQRFPDNQMRAFARPATRPISIIV